MRKVEVRNIVDDTVVQCENYESKFSCETCELQNICTELRVIDAVLDRKFKEGGKKKLSEFIKGEVRKR